MASVAIADTRAWSTGPVARSLAANAAVALRPDPAALGLCSVVVMMCLLTRRCGSERSVGAVVRELVGVDLDPEARSRTHGQFPAADLQRLGEQVVAHVQEVRQLAGAPGAVPVRGAEGDGARGADLAVDLVAHHDLGAHSLA